MHLLYAIVLCNCFMRLFHAIVSCGCCGTQVLVSVAAGVTLGELRKHACRRLKKSLRDQVVLIRLMPNTPAQVGHLTGGMAIWMN